VGHRRLDLPLARDIFVVGAGGLKSRAVKYADVGQIPGETLTRLCRCALEKVELVYPPLLQVALLGGEVEAPLLSIGE
jgi:hypothetical protein